MIKLRPAMKEEVFSVVLTSNNPSKRLGKK